MISPGRLKKSFNLHGPFIRGIFELVIKCDSSLQWSNLFSFVPYVNVNIPTGIRVLERWLAAGVTDVSSCITQEKKNTLQSVNGFHLI